MPIPDNGAALGPLPPLQRTLSREPQSGISYRPDIDGLRAVAVIAVVAAHVGLPNAEGGFVGVDIFFAISGFLMTALLTAEHRQAGRIDWARFFARRIRRLLPLALTVIVTTLLVSLWLVPPFGERQALAKVAAAAAFWSGNLMLVHLRESYFGGGAYGQPLTHFWSLGVEEQFYLGLPLALLTYRWLAGNSFSPARAYGALIAVGTLSLGLAVVGRQLSWDWAFYETPLRIYEFVIGAAAYLAPAPSSRRASRIAAAGGVVCIGVAILWFAEGQGYPGAMALVPSGGGALLLWVGRDRAAPVAKLLSTPALIQVGKLSYGWYLWHWPVLVLVRHYFIFETGLVIELGAGLAALGMAWFSYHLIEKPCRRSIPVEKTRQARRLIAIGAAASALTAILAGLVGLHAKWFDRQSDRFSVLGQQIAWPAKYFACQEGRAGLVPLDAGACQYGDPSGAVTVFVWGDSHANHLMPGLDQSLADLQVKGIEFSVGGCPPLLDFPLAADFDVYDACSRLNREALDAIARARARGPTAVILSARWQVYAGVKSYSLKDLAAFPGAWRPETLASMAAAFPAGLRKTLEELHTGGVPTLVLGPTPEFRRDPPQCLQRWKLPECSVEKSTIDGHQQAVLGQMRVTAQGLNAAVVDLLPEFCDSETCFPERAGVVLFRDDDHLSTAGAEYLAVKMNENVKMLVKRAQCRHDPSDCESALSGLEPNSHDKRRNP